MTTLRGGSFPRDPKGNTRARRSAAIPAQEIGIFKLGTITTVNSDHLLVQTLNESDIKRVDRDVFGTGITAVPPYAPGQSILITKLLTPRVADYPWIDMNVQGRHQASYYFKPISVNLPMLTKSITLRSCSISLPLSDTFTDSNGAILSAHFMDAGCGWSALNGGLTSSDWTIQSNKLQLEAAGTRRISCVTDDTTHDVQVSYTMGNAATTATARVFNRVTDANNYWQGQALYDTASLGVLSYIDIRELNAAVNTVRAASTILMAVGDNCTLLFEDGNPATDDLLLTISGDRTGSCTYNSTLFNTVKNVGIGASTSGAVTTKMLLDSFSCQN